MSERRTRIPDFDENGNLPPGVYRVSLEDVEARFTWNRRRRLLFRGLAEAVANLAAAGVRTIWVDGSFTTAKEEPGDIDGCWDYSAAVEVDLLDPVFLDVNPPRERMKLRYGVDLLIAGMRLEGAEFQRVEDFFQSDRDGNPRGILVVEIGGGT
jgi:hypothetical protein